MKGKVRPNSKMLRAEAEPNPSSALTELWPISNFRSDSVDDLILVNQQHLFDLNVII